MKVVHQLVRAGVVESTRGKGGGIRLARPPEEIRLGQVIRTSEGTTPIVECQEEQTSSCCIVPACQLSKILTRAFDTLYATLDEYTLADLMGKRRVLTRILIAPTNSGSSP
ncbi:MAG TPA: Rrf2 family transcriptional regulator, partial [Rhodocyclaceae bacterium]|nr:Rrf2 family transcriptional regulator [Rhodocyclaceae bacterium]